MHYVKHFDILGVDTRQIPCIELQGVPTAATKGAVGVLGIDMTSGTYEVYLCTGVKGDVYTWQCLKDVKLGYAENYFSGDGITVTDVTKDISITTDGYHFGRFSISDSTYSLGVVRLNNFVLSCDMVGDIVIPQTAIALAETKRLKVSYDYNGGTAQACVEVHFYKELTNTGGIMEDYYYLEISLPVGYSIRKVNGKVHLGYSVSLSKEILEKIENGGEQGEKPIIRIGANEQPVNTYVAGSGNISLPSDAGVSGCSNAIIIPKGYSYLVLATVVGMDQSYGANYEYNVDLVDEGGASVVWNKIYFVESDNPYYDYLVVGSNYMEPDYTVNPFDCIVLRKP